MPFFAACLSLQIILYTISNSQYAVSGNQSNIYVYFISALVSTILKLVYGMNIHEDDDSDYAKIIEIVAAAIVEAGNPGTFLVDLLPFMKFIPAWFPGAGWKRKANYWRKVGEYFVNTPWNTVKEQLVA